MKKQTRKQKVYALRRRMKLNARRIKHSIKLKHYRIYGDRLSKRPSIGEGRRVKLQVPESLSLETHYDEVIALVEGIREHGVRKENKPFINFEKLRNVGPCGALLLAAELDRWRTVRGFRHEVFPKKWDPEVLRLMDEMGLFEILNVANPPLIKPPETGDMRFIRFRSHAETIGESASDMAAEIEAMAGAIPRWNKLFAGLTEAMTNVSNHAYPKDVDYKTQPLMKKWWMAGSFNSKTNRIMIIFYDQGVGIPVTLPRKHKKEKVRKALSYLGLPENDASLIRAAMEFGRSRTDESHRGGGLFRDIRKYTDLIPDGRFRALSNRGEYIYVPNEPRSSVRERLLTHSQSIGGTLLLWEGTIPSGDAP